ncbi:hypothetical protein Tco_0179282, partial [Tanacetum coccineum]
LIEGRLIMSICSQEWMEGHVGNEAVHKELGDKMERAATTASSLEAEHDSGSGPRIGVDTARHKLNTASIKLVLPEGSKGFHQIIDFLTASHIRYAFTKSPTIYVSLIEQFWQTASTSTLENRDMEITATIDGKVKVVFEASIRRQLKLEDSDEEAATMPHDSPLLRVYSLGSDEGSMTLNELIVLCTTLSKKVETLESDLKQTKLTYGAAYTKLIMKVKKLEHKGRHKHDFEESDFVFIAPEEDYTVEPDISTTNVPVSIVSEEVSTASPEVETAAESLVYIRRSEAKRKDKGKAIMKESKHVQKKTKLQLEQERLGLEEALRLQEQLDEEERQRIARVHEEANTFNDEE